MKATEARAKAKELTARTGQEFKAQSDYPRGWIVVGPPELCDNCGARRTRTLSGYVCSENPWTTCGGLIPLAPGPSYWKPETISRSIKRGFPISIGEAGIKLGRELRKAGLFA